MRDVPQQVAAAGVLGVIFVAPDYTHFAKLRHARQHTTRFAFGVFWRLLLRSPDEFRVNTI
jgi:hypothetical protein